MSENLGKYADTLAAVVVGIVAVALAGGIGAYILYQFNVATNNSISSWANLLNNVPTMVGTVITILLVSVMALAGIYLIKLLRGTASGGS